MRKRNFFFILCSVVLMARLFQIQMIKRRSSDSLILSKSTVAPGMSTAAATAPLILPVVKRGLQEDYCYIYEGIFSTATKTLDRATEFIGEHVDIVQDAVEDGYFWAVSRFNHVIETVWDVMMDIYLAPELEWCMFWSVLNRYLHHQQQQQQQSQQHPEKDDMREDMDNPIDDDEDTMKKPVAVTLLGNKEYEMNWNEIVCSAPLEYGLRAPQLQQEFRKLANRAITKTRHTIQSNQVDWLHTLRGIQQSVMDAHSTLLVQYNEQQQEKEEDQKALIHHMRNSRRRLKRLIRHQVTEIHMHSIRSFRRLDKTIHRMFHDAGMTPMVDTSSQMVCLDKLRQYIMQLSRQQYEHGMDRILTTGKIFGHAVMDTLETSLTVFMDESMKDRKEYDPLDGAGGYYLIGVNGTDVMVTTVPMVVYSSMKRVDVDLAILAKTSTDISEEMEKQMCGSWEAASRQMSRSEDTWYHWLIDWWNFLKFTLWVVLKVIISFF
ncbi:hypothetical protein BDA99DRAFT_542435 [Phascolomyces articulosus]|uniref:Uncharacterized protein n=1 Tax=Phascolomyces articulosus TaxID=60185 RepID=A0AAD5P8V8_9FUNG|nr:hypothetical protein BDA99DRAFT_542435 [Phascolomyces articulosus]